MPDAALALRAFGQAEDLNLDFASRDRPALVTALLAACSAGSAALQAAAHWWAQPVGRRTAALLHLLGLSSGQEVLPLQAQCQATECAERFEFELPLPALLAAPGGTEPLALSLPDGRQLQLRCPTGEDLRNWQAQRPPSREAALSLMLNSLVQQGTVHPGDETELATALAAQDPLVGFSVACRCPACGRPQEQAVDLEGIALQRLASLQQELLRQVHRLATHYGWTEGQVLAVPPQRRARYIELIEAGA